MSETVSETLRALAHPDRRMFLKACRPRSMSAGELAALSSLSAATVSEHLKVLRKTGLLVLQRDGKSWLYRTDPDAVAAALAAAAADVGA
jgi:DNA-binding transcriptional ArsR family regulator